MNNFYLIDKPLGVSSFDIIRKLRKILGVRKMWHTGTLDPLATWAVLVAVGWYTKLIPFLEKDTKEYEFEVMLDWTTDSFDLAEEVQYIRDEDKSRYKKELTIDTIKKVLDSDFSWNIKQIPPKYSALKINGKKAYDLARVWQEVSIKPREVTIFSIEIIDFAYPKLSLKAKVSAWTYIRSIANDLGAILWTGWYISKLRRTKIGHLDIKEAQELDSFDKSKNIEVKNLFGSDSFIELEKEVLDKINNGLQVSQKFDFAVNKDLFVEQKGEIKNIVTYDGEKLSAKRKI